MKKLLLAVLLVCGLAHANEFPTGPVKIVMALPAGSGPDAMTRKLAEILSAKWQVPVLIENKPGGLGVPAMDYFVKAPADGQTIFLAGLEHVVSYPLLYNDNRYSPQFTPIAPFFKNDMVLFTSTKVNDFSELKERIKRRPIFGSQSVGSGQHMAGYEFAEPFLSQIPQHVPYREYGQWYVDTYNQEVTYGFSTIASTKSMVDSGKLRILAITTKQRDPAYPNIPTVKELIGRDIIANGWLAFYTNKNTPQPIKDRLIKDMNDAIRTKEMQAAIRSYDYGPWNISIPEFEAIVAQDTNKFRKSFIKYNVKVN